MEPKTEAQIEREKAAVAAMKNAKSNMDEVLARVATLERLLGQTSNTISRLKRHVGSESQMTWHDGRQERRDFVTKYADEQIAEIAKVVS